MTGRRHKDDSAFYRELESHKERVQSFNMTVNNLVDYARVQTEMDTTATRAASDIVERRIETLRKAIDRINRLA